MEDLKAYTTDEVQEILKVTRRTLYNYIKAGQLKAVKIGKGWRISEDSLREFMAQGTEKDYMEKIGYCKKGK